MKLIYVRTQEALVTNGRLKPGVFPLFLIEAMGFQCPVLSQLNDPELSSLDVAHTHIEGNARSTD